MKNVRRRRKIAIPNSKHHSLLIDHKTGKRTIITANPICRGCFKDFKDGDKAYLGDVTRLLICYKCIAEGTCDYGNSSVSTVNDHINTVYYCGDIKIKKEVEE